MQISFVRHKRDSHPQQFNPSWEDLIDTLLEHQNTLSLKDGPGLIGASFKEGGKRRVEDVLGISLLICDIENGLLPSEFKTLFTAYQGIMYSTWSDGIPKKCPNGERRFRGILPLARSIDPIEYKALWQWCQEYTGNSLDTSTIDPCRLQYTPRRRNPESTLEPFLEVWEGQLLNPDALPDGRNLKDILLEILKVEHQSLPKLGEQEESGRPGDDYNRQADLLKLLQEHGWQVTGWTGTSAKVLKPNGRTGEHSGYVHHDQGIPIFVNFSSTAPAPFNQLSGSGYSVWTAFSTYAHLEHEGDFGRAAAALRASGYGAPLEEFSTADNKLSHSGGIIANFSIEPLRVLLLEGDTQQRVECRILTESGESFDQIFDKNVFGDPKTFNAALGPADAIFLGKTANLRRLQVWLTRPEVQRIHGIGYQGRWEDPSGGRPLWVTEGGAFSSEGVVDNPPVTVVSDLSGRFVPLDYPNLEPDLELLELFAENILNLNFRHVILPILGWHMACPYKSVLFSKEYKFPILNLWGTRGGGKTTQVQLFQRLLGYREPQGLDCYGKQFVQLNRSGATNGIPILFAEYRRSIPESAHTAFIRDLMMAYDGTVDARGRPDLSVVLYPKLAPVVVDGNEGLHEPALLERCLQVYMSQDALRDPRSDFVRSYYRIAAYRPLQAFAGPYIRWTLEHAPPIEDAREIVLRNPGALLLSERVRRNLEVTVCGLLSIKNYMLYHGYDFLPIEQVGAYVKHYVNEMAITRRLDVEDFVEDLFYLYQKGGVPFLKTSKVPEEGTVLWFHMKSAYPEWAILCRRTGRTPISVESLEMQLAERVKEYIIRSEDASTGSFQGINLWGIVLHKTGLDVPRGIV